MNKALVVIDIQNDITKNYKEIIDNINSAIDWAKKNDFHIVYIKHNNIKRGPQYALIITAGNKELELNKQMEGFDIMVEYLLRKYNDGKIDDKVMSKHCCKLLSD